MVGMHDLSTEMMSNKLEETLSIIKKVNAQFKNPVSLLFILFLCHSLFRNLIKSYCVMSKKRFISASVYVYKKKIFHNFS